MTSISRLLTVIGVCLLPMFGNSQILLSLLFGDKLNSDGLSFGIHGDYSFNKMSNMAGDKSLRSLNLGLFFTWHFSDQWHLNLEMLPKYKRGMRNLPVYAVESDSLNTLFTEGHIDRRIKYLTLPVTGQYMLSNGLFAELGPQLSFRLKARDLLSTSLEDGTLSLEKNIDDQIHRWDIGWLAGLGYRFTKSKLIAVGVRYQGGFSDVEKSIAGKQQHQQWGVYCNLPMGKTKPRLSE